MAIDDDSGSDGGGGTWDASRSIDDIAEAHRTGGQSGFGLSPPPGDIGPFADRKVGHYTQVNASSHPSPTKVGGTSLIEVEAGRASAPMPPEGMASRQPATVQRHPAEPASRGSHLNWASGGPMPEAQIHAHAAEGIAGPGSPVPFRPQLEHSLGPAAAPILDRISVHQDQKAQAASAAIGAQAFAAGDDIALPRSPSVHLVAHEVAHVVQQAEGVHLSGGVGHEGDPYEREADAFADAVVAGEPTSSARLASFGPPKRGAVQRSATNAAHDHGPSTPRDGHPPAAPPGASHGAPAHDASAERESGDRSEVERLEVAVRFAENSAKLALGSHVPEFIAARDRLDAEGMQRLGHDLIAAVGAMKGAEAAIAKLVGRASMSRPCASIAQDEKDMLAVTTAQLKQPLIDSLKDTVEVTVAGAMIPQHFRGRDLAGHGVAKETGTHLQRDLSHHLHSSVGAVRLARLINETLAVGHGVAPGEGLLADIWQKLREWQHQPLYLALIRAAAGPNWTLIDRTEDTSGKHGAFAEAAEAAEVGGWTGNVGTFDLKEATHLLADGKRDGAEQVLARLFSADDASRSRMLMEIRGAGLLDLLCSPLGWAQIKELHDSLEEGHFGGIKQDLQRYFLGSDKFGPRLDQENDRMSAAKLIGKAGLLGDATNFALNLGTFGFYGGYSDAWDARAQGQSTDAEYRQGAADTTMRTIVVGGVSLVTGGLADKVVRGGTGAVTAGRAIAGGVAGGAVGSVSGLATSDAITMAETHGETGFSSPEAYVEAALVGGAFGGAMGAGVHGYNKLFPGKGAVANSTAGERGATHAESDALDAPHSTQRPQGGTEAAAADKGGLDANSHPPGRGRLDDPPVLDEGSAANSLGRAPSEAEAARKEVIERYKDLTASDIASVEDPRLQEIAEAARAENRDVQARLRAALERAGITDIEIQYRAKSLRSILGKLQETPGMKVKDIKDLSGIRVNISNVKEANFAQYENIKAAIQQEFEIPDTAVKDYNKKPNPWGYTGRVHMFEVGGAEIVSEIQVGSKDLSEFIEKKFATPNGGTIELHDLTGFKGQLYGKAIPQDLQTEYQSLIGKITKVNEGGRNLADIPEAQAEVDAYFARVQNFLDAP